MASSWIAKLVILLVFIKIGAVSFGGAYSIWTLVQQEFVEKPPAFLGETAPALPEPLFYQYMEVGRMTPGPNINGALLVGHYYQGIAGLFLVFVGLTLPSLFAMIFLYHLNRRLGADRFFMWFKRGALAGVIGILLSFMHKISAKIPTEHIWQPFLFCAFAGLLFVLIHYKRANVILVTVYSGLVTWAFYWFW